MSLILKTEATTNRYSSLTMNDKNHSKPNHEQSSADSLWAKFIDQRDQPTSAEASDEPDDIAQIDLNSELLDHLELDGVLRVLGKMSGQNDASFTDKVIAQTHPELSKRLPSIEPAFLTGTLEAESEFASTTDDSVQESSTASSIATPRRPLAVLLASLAATILIGCFVGSIWWFNTESEIARSQDSKSKVLRNSDESKISDDDSEIPKAEEDKTPFAADESLVQQLFDKDSSPRTEPAPTEESNLADNTGAADSNPLVVDVESKIDSAGDSKGLPLDPFDDAFDPKGVIAKIPNQNKPSWDSKFDWHLAIQFNANGMGSVSLNDNPMEAIFLRDNTAFLLRQIGSELERRVRFLEDRIGSQINGSIQIGRTNYRFRDISKIDVALDEVDRHLAGLHIRSLPVAELMNLRGKYRKKMMDRRSKFTSIDLANKHSKFYTEDEAFAICSVLSVSEDVLRKLSRARLAWERRYGIRPPEPRFKDSITLAAFQVFAKSRKLALPEPKFSAQSIASIQKLGPAELTGMLLETPSIELFKDVDEFQQGRDFVLRNVSETRLQTAINRNDRLISQLSSNPSSGGSDRKQISGDEIRKLSEENSRLRQELSAEKSRTRGSGNRNPKTALTIEPLKDILSKRTDLQGLPLVMGKECRREADEARHMGQVSSSVGRMIGRFNGSLGSRDKAQNDAFRNLSIRGAVSECIRKPSEQKLKTIDQIVQIDHPRLRLELIEALRKSDSDAAVKLIADKAKYDFEPEVRIAATDALANIEPSKYRELLLEGLKYPWHVVAEHSAEALVRLDDRKAIPKLIEMLDLPHPHVPIEVNGQFVQRELVAINHMRNCLLCHAPSVSSSDLVRGTIPDWDLPIPHEYYDSGGYSVRADITYLQQDFSIVRPVENPGPWPSDQRFDFVVQNKKVIKGNVGKITRQMSKKRNQNRQAVIYALQKLTGQAPKDNSPSNWKRIAGSYSLSHSPKIKRQSGIRSDAQGIGFSSLSRIPIPVVFLQVAQPASPATN